MWPLIGRINGVTALKGFSYKKMHGRFAWKKQSGNIYKVTVISKALNVKFIVELIF